MEAYPVLSKRMWLRYLWNVGDKEIPEFFDFSLEHPVGIEKGVIGVFGFVDGHL